MEPNVFTALVLSMLSGATTMIGYFVIYLPRKNDDAFMALCLSFAAGVMLCVSFTDLLPSAFEYLCFEFSSLKAILISVIFVFIGVALISITQKVIFARNEVRSEKNNLYRVGLVSMLAMAIHNFSEGMVGFMAGYSGFEKGLSVLIALAFHNIPEGMTIALPVYASTNNKKKAFRFTLFSASAQPLGALCTFLVLQPFMSEKIMGAVFAFNAGIMIYTALCEMLSQAYKWIARELAASCAIFGICFMLVLDVFT